MYQLEDERETKNDKIVKLTECISELELQLGKKEPTQMQQSTASNGAEGKVCIKLKWREGKKMPRKVTNCYLGMMAAAVDGNSVYIMEHT